MTRDEQANLYSAVLAAADYQVMGPADESDRDKALRFQIQAGLQETLYALADPADYPDPEERDRHRQYSQRFALDARELAGPRSEWSDDMERAEQCWRDLLQARN